MFNSGDAQAVVSQDHAHTGKHSVKAIIAGDGGVRLFRWNEPRLYTELYYSGWYYFPQRYKPVSWWNIWQWKSRTAAGVDDPFLLLEVKNRPTGEMYLSLYDWQNHVDFYSQTPKNIPVGQWVHIEGFQKCASDKSGQVTIWQDGVQLFDTRNVQTRYSDGDCRWSIDNYSSGVNPSPTIIYIDDASISLTRP